MSSAERDKDEQTERAQRSDDTENANDSNSSSSGGSSQNTGGTTTPRPALKKRPSALNFSSPVHRPNVRFSQAPPSLIRNVTSGEPSIGPRPLLPSSTTSPRESSPLSSPPIVASKHHRHEDDYFTAQHNKSSSTSAPSTPNKSGTESPSLMLTRPDDSQVNLMKNLHQHGSGASSSSSRNSLASMKAMGLIPLHDSDDQEYPTDEESTSLMPPQQAHVAADDTSKATEATRQGMLSNLLQMGLYSGAVPSASGFRKKDDGSDVGDDLKERREALLRSLNDGTSTPNSVASSPQSYSHEFSTKNGDIPLLELDRRLSEVKEKAEFEHHDAAENLVRSHTLHKSRMRGASADFDADKGYLVANDDYFKGLDTPMPDQTNFHHSSGNPDNHDFAEDWVARPSHVKQGVLGSLLKLYADDESATTAASTPRASTDTRRPASQIFSRPPLSPTKSSEAIPKSRKEKWYNHNHSRSMNSLTGLVMHSAQTLAAPGAPADAAHGKSSVTSPIRPKFPRKHSGGVKKKRKHDERRFITVHIADVLQRQRFLLRMCRALMLYGAPTHRLEEYMKMSARVLEIDGQFLYIPGCMLVSFGDPSTHTSETQIVRVVQGLNLGKLHKAHTIYKEVVHDMINVEEASERIDELLASKNRFPDWLCVLMFGMASAMVTPFAFGGWWQDLPMAFIIGSFVGLLQIVVAPRSDLYNNVFEVTSSIIVSFVGRAFGSIGGETKVFCFAAITQGSLAMILPGYMILTGSLEMQSKNIVSGSVRMFYAVIYSIFLGFGITMGAAIYGWIDSNAVNDTKCRQNIGPLYKILFVPGYTVFVSLVYQSNFRQVPIAVVISAAGYTVTYFINEHVSGSSEFTSAIGAFVIGLLGNIYSRIGHGLAFAAMLPGIFVQLPGSVAAQGSLIAGLKNANELVQKHNHTTILVTSTVTASGVLSTFTTAIETTLATPTTTSSSNSSLGSDNVLSLGLTMIQVCIGITVGLFVATLCIYPFGKKRSGLFTF